MKMQESNDFIYLSNSCGCFFTQEELHVLSEYTACIHGVSWVYAQDFSALSVFSNSESPTALLTSMSLFLDVNI